MRTIAPSLPAYDQADNPRLVLRDGSVASVRVAEPSDCEAIRRFFHDLSPDSLRKRFFMVSEPPASLINVFGDNRDPSQTLTLLVHRYCATDVRPIAVASYFALNHQRAEVAFAVDDHFQGKGLATALLERLAVLAASRGFELFEASTLDDNTAMLEVFRDSGFEIRSKSRQGVVAVTLSLTPSVDGVHRAEERDRLATSTSLRPLFRPSAVAVIGASRDAASIGRRVFDAVRSAGFEGAVYPVNPGVTELDGLRCYASARDLPGGVDLAVIAVPARAVLAVVDDCAAAGVKSLVVISAGFSEAGAAGRDLQRLLVERVRNYGMRMVGPNCMGLLNDRQPRLQAAPGLSRPPAGGHRGTTRVGASDCTAG
jgi:acetate---CoA ligase (ADP-forming)